MTKEGMIIDSGNFTNSELLCNGNILQGCIHLHTHCYERHYPH